MNSCPKCGTTFPIVEETTVAPRGFSAKKNIIIILLAALLVLGVGTAVTAFAVTHSPSYQVSHGLKLAERYLSEQNYQQAVIEFLNVLEIEPMNVDAYLGLADAYIGLGEIDKAIEILQEGLDRTGDDRIRAKLNELLKPQKPEPEPEPDPAPEPEPPVSSVSSSSSVPESSSSLTSSSISSSTSTTSSSPSNSSTITTSSSTSTSTSTSTSSSTSTAVSSSSSTAVAEPEPEEVTYVTIRNIRRDIETTTSLRLVSRLTNDEEMKNVSMLTNLTSLTITDAGLIDISVLSSLTKLEKLTLGYNEIVDLTPLANLTNLTELELYNNRIVDLTPLSNLKNLTYLHLGGTGISDDHNLIEDISPLSNLTNLTQLYLGANPFTDITPLAPLTKLETLNLLYCNISDVYQFEDLHFPNMKSFSFRSKQTITVADVRWLGEHLQADAPKLGTGNIYTTK